MFRPLLSGIIMMLCQMFNVYMFCIGYLRSQYLNNIQSYEQEILQNSIQGILYTLAFFYINRFTNGDYHYYYHHHHHLLTYCNWAFTRWQ